MDEYGRGQVVAVLEAVREGSMRPRAASAEIDRIYFLSQRAYAAAFARG